MANKSSPTLGVSAPPPAGRERTDRGLAAAGPRPPSQSTQPPPSNRAPAGFDPSSSREALIATAAYYRAQKRGFRPGHETEDWLAAEREVDGTGTAPNI